MIEINTLEGFQRIKEKGLGYIAITDRKLPINRVHSVLCSDVTEHYFVMKVINSLNKNGSYYYTDDFQVAIERFEKMVKCEKCLG